MQVFYDKKKFIMFFFLGNNIITVEAQTMTNDCIV